MMRRLTWIAVVWVWLLGTPASAQTLYWTDVGTGKIQRAEVGGATEDLVLGQTHSKLGLAVDFDGDKLYWAHDDSGTWRIRRANLDGMSVSNLIDTGTRMADGIAVDVAGGRIYWGEFDPVGLFMSRLMSAELDGSDVTELVPGLANPVGVALDTVAGKVYWADPVFVHRIERANLDGSNVETITSSPVLPFGVALDAAAGKIYWADFQTGEIQRADLDGTSIETLVDGLDEPRGVALDLTAGKLYWTRPGAIERADLDGGKVETLFSTGLVTPAGIAITASGPLRLTVGRDELSWGHPGGALHFDLVHGDLAALQSNGGDFAVAGVSCLAFDVTGESVPFTDQPFSGEGFWLLARRVTAAGNQSYNSGGPSQASPRDPSITASGADCP